jgi:hypothetical protein
METILDTLHSSTNEIVEQVGSSYCYIVNGSLICETVKKTN